jgi:hypothetical protein
MTNRIVNIFLALSSTAKNTVRPLMADEDYNGTHVKAVKILRHMANIGVVEKFWETPTIAGKQRHLYSVVFKVENPKKTKEALDFLTTEYPNDAHILGAWWYDTGLQVGTTATYDDEGAETITGTPLYPIHSRLIDFMPPDITWD